MILIFGYKITMKSKRKTAMTADIYTGKDFIDNEEQEFLAQKAANERENPSGWFYRNFIAWLL